MLHSTTVELHYLSRTLASEHFLTRGACCPLAFYPLALLCATFSAFCFRALHLTIPIISNHSCTTTITSCVHTVAISITKFRKTEYVLRNCIGTTVVVFSVSSWRARSVVMVSVALRCAILVADVTAAQNSFCQQRSLLLLSFMLVLYLPAQTEFLDIFRYCYIISFCFFYVSLDSLLPSALISFLAFAPLVFLRFSQS